MISKLAILFTCSLLAFCESAFVESLQKCAIEDSSCIKGLIQNIVTRIGKNGLIEYNIDPVDPFDLKNMKIPIVGLLTINIVEGEARGVKDCVIEKIESDAKERRFVLQLTCDLKIKVKVKLADLSTLVQSSFGVKSIEGGGNAKIRLDKLKLKLEYFYDIVKKEDGEIYIKCKPEKTIYDYEIGDANVVVDKMVFGDFDASEQINEIFKSNLKDIIKTFGKSLFDVALGVLNNIVETFFKRTPTKYFIKGDLSPSS